jgi:S-adenosylmethionine:tRNA ribosyltransferase-isomerase
MRLEDFDYELPLELVAQEPAARREDARLLVHDVGADETRHSSVSDLPELLSPRDLLVLNDTRVLPVRLFGRRSSGGRVEVLLTSLETPPAGWRALVNPARKLRAGEEIPLEGGALLARMVERAGDEWRLELLDCAREPATEALLEAHGRMPLPPYVRRPRGGPDAWRELDRERYQTVFAREPGAVAAPTAGLHLSHELLERIETRGIALARVTLHVGPGTFRPVSTERVEEHRMHAESYVVSPEVCAAIAACRARGGRVIAVGTTSLRALESRPAEGGVPTPGGGETELFVLPGHRFAVIDALLTNFHLPRSTLLMLVSAFAGRERILRLYAEAVTRRYRFFSYGDAMLLLGQPAGAAS